METVSSVSDTFMGLVTDEQYIIIAESCGIVYIWLSLLGIVSNIVNIKTFINMRISDGITFSFFGLSVLDLFYVITSFSLGINVTLGVDEWMSTTMFTIDPYGVAVFASIIMVLVNLTNVLVTTFLAVARCMCVARPLSFKNTFTRKRTIVFFVLFAIFSISINTPILANMGFAVQFNKRTNTSRLTLWVSPSRQSIKVSVLIVVDLMLPIISQVVTLLCVIVMSNSLRAATRFRLSLTQESVLASQVTSDPSNGNSNLPDKLSGKDLRAVQQVALISIVYIVCNTPKIILSVAGVVEPEFTLDGRFTNLYVGVNAISKHFQIVNASMNTIIYYVYNTKFRQVVSCDIDKLYCVCQSVKTDTSATLKQTTVML